MRKLATRFASEKRCNSGNKTRIGSTAKHLCSVTATFNMTVLAGAKRLMNELVARLAATVGIDTATATKALAIVTGFLSAEAPDASRALFAHLPGADAFLQAHQNDSAGSFNSGGLMGVATRLMGAGLGMGQIETFGREFFQYARATAGDDAVGDVAAAIPALKQLI